MHTLVIGSSIIDLFLGFEDEKNLIINDAKLCLALGDKIPIEINRLAIGGNGANVSVGLTKLEIPTTFFTYLGNDIFSREIEENIRKEGVELIVERGASDKSSLSLVFSLKNDRIIFSHHQIRDHQFNYNKDRPDFSYITSLGREWVGAYKQIFSYLTQNSVDYAFAPGSHQLMDQNEAFTTILGSSKILFINKEEAVKILGKEFEGSDSVDKILKSLKDKGPKIISMTDGAQGAYLIDEEGEVYSIKPFTQAGMAIEKTGAGDAYASGFLASYLSGNKPSEAMRWGGINASYSMSEVGAQAGLVKKNDMIKILGEHADYQANKI